MPVLRIHLLGGLELQVGEQQLPAFETQKARSLFAFLVLHRERSFARGVLASTFWGERPETLARKCLRTELWRIRTMLESSGIDASEYLHVRNQEVGFNTSASYWLDLEEFEKRVDSVKRKVGSELTAQESQTLDEALDLYRGDLLEGTYDDWCNLHRERLKVLYIHAMERLMQHYQAREEWTVAIARGLQLLNVDPLLEHVHRDLMRCYFQMGNRPAALRQYAACAELLQRELDVEPMEETVQLYDEIRADRRDGAPRLKARAAPPPEGDAGDAKADEFARALADLYEAETQLEEARERLRRAINQFGELQARALGKIS